MFWRHFHANSRAISVTKTERRVWIACGKDYTSISPIFHQNCVRSRNSGQLCNRRYVTLNPREDFALSRGFRRDFVANSRASSTAMAARVDRTDCDRDFEPKPPKMSINCFISRNGTRLRNRRCVASDAQRNFALSRGSLGDFHANSHAINTAMMTRRDWIDYGKDFAPKSPKIRQNCDRPRNSSRLCNRSCVASNSRGYVAHFAVFSTIFTRIHARMTPRRREEKPAPTVMVTPRRNRLKYR